jgi:hypothetical protein
MNHTKGHYTTWRGTYEANDRTHEANGYFIHPRELSTLKGIERALNRNRKRIWQESGRPEEPPKITVYAR